MKPTGRIGRLTKDTIESLRPEIKSLDWVVKFGRRISHIGPDYGFSGIVIPGSNWENFPVIQNLMENINRTLGTNFNSCLINWYPKGRPCGIGAHKDIESCLVPNTGVCSVSLGIDSDCEFIFRDGRKAIVKQFTLKHGDVFWFNGEDNRRYTHEIPKTIFPNGRISLTFRHFKVLP